MREIKSAVLDIESAFEKTPYPEEFLEAYDQMECLASRCGRETFLVREKNGEALYVAKCYDKSVFAFSPGADLLRALDHEGLPRYIGRFENDSMLCIVREYIEGMSLADCAETRAISREEIVRICLKLCDILIYLHGQPRPILHRDIKPSNVILTPDGNITLIDFDIARMYRDGADEDTIFFGTKGYAPPEQYGFSQTDCRADIYSFGVFLRFLLTGSVRENANISIAPELQRVIDRCAAFSPKDRYGSMEEVKAALLRAKRRSRMTRRPAFFYAVMAAALLLLGFSAGRFTELFAPREAAVSFSEPLIEAAVRAQLGSGRGSLTADDLLRVKALYIYGTRVFKSEEELRSLDVADSVRGQLHSLSDIALLPNLEELCVIHQGEVDISALENAKNLRSVEMKHAHIEDCAPLRGLRALRNICLFDTDISDFTPLSYCFRLESLDVGLTPAVSARKLGVHPWLTSLGLMWMRMESLEGIEQMPRLRTVFLQHAEIGDLSALLLLPELRTVYADEGNYDELCELLAGTNAAVVKE